MTVMLIERQFYLETDVVRIARDLIGKYLFTNIEGNRTGGIIIETEAYEGVTDMASHAFGGRRSVRTEIMYRQGGTAYVYLCYGIHSLFNIVTNAVDVPHAVLIRGIMPVEGLETMKKRSMKPVLGKGAGSGPGKVSKLLGIHYSQSGVDLLGKEIWLEDRGLNFGNDLIVSTRIGVDYAGDDARLPYRFFVPESRVII